jgi:CHAT domain-containing protein
MRSPAVLQAAEAKLSNVERELPAASVFHFTGVRGYAPSLEEHAGQPGTSHPYYWSAFSAYGRA